MHERCQTGSDPRVQLALVDVGDQPGDGVADGDRAIEVGEGIQSQPDQTIFLAEGQWILPPGAFGESNGPTLIARAPMQIYFSCTGDSMKPKITRDKLERLWRDPVNWKRGLIYSCKDDHRIVVPKKQKRRGWTINFAHRRATPTLIFMILAAGLPVF